MLPEYFPTDGRKKPSRVWNSNCHDELYELFYKFSEHALRGESSNNRFRVKAKPELSSTANTNIQILQDQDKLR